MGLVVFASALSLGGLNFLYYEKKLWFQLTESRNNNNNNNNNINNNINNNNNNNNNSNSNNNNNNNNNNTFIQAKSS